MEQFWDFTVRHNKARLQEFAQMFKDIQALIDFRVSSRGWCYIMEQKGYINKSQFDKVEEVINRCRRLGYLPVDFVAEEEGRKFSNIHVPTNQNYDAFISNYLDYVDNCEYYFSPDWWDGEKYYIQMLVEKIDLKTLFVDVTNNFHIPIATSKGWSSILQRAEYARRFAEAEAKGLQCVLLYCGDHDPDGLRISDFLFDNLDQIKDVVWSDGQQGFDPQNLLIARFGLNYDFIIENELSWIDNLITGSGLDLASKKHKNHDMPYVQEYLSEIGARKCEANAIVVIPDKARELCKGAIEYFLGEDALARFKLKKIKTQRAISELKSEVDLDNRLFSIKNDLSERFREKYGEE